MAAFTLLPQPFRATSLPDITAKPIPHATADPGTLVTFATTTSTKASESIEITGFTSWSDHGGLSVYTDVRTTGTPRVAGLGAISAVGQMTISNRSVWFRSGGQELMISASSSKARARMRIFWGIWMLVFAVQFVRPLVFP